MMKPERHNSILKLLEESEELSLGELARRLGRVSLVTVRRDVAELAEQSKLVRHHGSVSRVGAAEDALVETGTVSTEFDAVDAFVLPPFDGRAAETLRLLATRRGIPVLAESSPRDFGSYLGPDNFAVGRDLGNRAGRAFRGPKDYANLLLVSIEQLPNTRQRVEGFEKGFRETFDGQVKCWRIDSRGSYRTAIDGCMDVLETQSDIQIVFGVNDHAVLAALDATERYNSSAIAYSIGGEGDLLFETLSNDSRLRACAALFPTIVAAKAIDELARVFQGGKLPTSIDTPHVVLTADNLADYYEKSGETWKLRPEVLEKFTGVLPKRTRSTVGKSVGFAPHFPAHDWYRNMEQAMISRCEAYGIRLKVSPPQAGVAREIDSIRREIARHAVADIRPGETVAINAGPMQHALGDALATRRDLTIVTNSLDLFERLSKSDGLKVLITSGELHSDARCIVGPSVGALFEMLRADRCLLSVDGLSIRFGPSALGEREALAARRLAKASSQVIGLADHSIVGSDANHRIVPIDGIDQVIVDIGTLPKDRLALSDAGVQVQIAGLETSDEDRPKARAAKRQRVLGLPAGASSTETSKGSAVDAGDEV